MSKFYIKKFFWHLFVMGLGLITTGCSVLLPAPTPLPTATVTETLMPTPTIDWFPATPTASGTPQATATPQPTLPDQQLGVGALLVMDDFSQMDFWATQQSQAGNIAYGINNLTLAVASEEAYLLSLSRHEVPANVYLEIELETALCAPDDQFGLIFWQQSQGDYYRLLLNCASQYRLELVQGGQRIVLHDWESASRMQSGAPAHHQIGFWVYQGQFRLFINDTFQMEEKLAQDRSGLLGVFAQTLSSAALTVKFSNLNIYEVILD